LFCATMWKSFVIVFAAVTAVGVMGSNTTLGSTYGGVAFTHCGSGSSCGGHQHCDRYELALSDAGIWNALVGIPMSGGYNKCPGGNWQQCCSGSHSGVCSKLPSCPLDSMSATKYPVCVKASNGKQQTAYVTGCCPSHHPCNICKAEKHMPGACTQHKDQADLCDNLWHALGSPSQSTSLTLGLGKCGGPSPSPPGPPPGCKDVAPDSKYSCAQQKSWGKCSQSFMKGHCCQTCFNCKSGCHAADEYDVTV